MHPTTNYILVSQLINIFSVHRQSTNQQYLGFKLSAELGSYLMVTVRFK